MGGVFCFLAGDVPSTLASGWGEKKAYAPPPSCVAIPMSTENWSRPSGEPMPRRTSDGSAVPVAPGCP